MINQLGLSLFPGYANLHTRAQADGAIANGTRVRKTNSEPGDTHKDDERATILGSIHHPEVGFGYFVEWDTHPKAATFVTQHRITPSPDSEGKP